MFSETKPNQTSGPKAGVFAVSYMGVEGGYAAREEYALQERLEVSTQKLLLVQGQPLRSLKAGLELLLPAGGPHPGMCLSPPFPLEPKACEVGEGGPGKALCKL